MDDESLVYNITNSFISKLILNAERQIYLCLMKFICSIWLIVSCFFSVQAQTVYPKREFRAVWIATIANIDWPSKSGFDAEQQKQEFINLLNLVKANGLNAVIVQIRPSADAIYASSFENWSRYLTGKQGMPPTPYYDPLQFMIEESHKKCIEFHAWFNPYRALVDAMKNPNTPDHITFQHPEWFVNYGGKKYFNPGLPEVRTYFTKIVMDVVKRYDIDAVHFDDYFYPYRIADKEFPDQQAFMQYGSSFSSKDNWRRDNVNKLMESLSKKIKELKPYVKFGISPFGVWRNIAKDEDGSITTAGQTNYDDLYADVLLWQKKGWIDYLLPQLYWEIGHKAADYSTLLDWWNRHAYGRHMYIGHGLYQVGTSKKPCWNGMAEIGSQISLLRNANNIQGSALYSANSFTKNKNGCNNYLQQQVYKKPALLPTMKWIDSIAPQAPSLKISYDRDNYRVLQWTSKNTAQENLQFAIYKFLPNENVNIQSAKNLVAIVSGNSWTDKNKVDAKYQYVVTALDRLHNESATSNVAE